MALKAGRLRHRVDIQARQDVQDPDTGDVTPTWVTVWPNVPAAIEPLSAREFIAAQAVQSQVVARITMRYREGLDASMRILHKSTVYNIAGLLPDKDSGLEYFTVPVSAGVNNG
ncbi:head-tail adaptor [Pseudomonas sp. BAY1663]|uniref:phage head closure protein n=1 Tax=Pseudomonas sp. BAY1663 TaxID=1439940 RepID=UPI00042E121E|nr:phage head closure protein [Pseudomonas sp. BAY1663]EXF45266.1 head-tail adaptor [Pseudomonas sp. BAY1663]